MIFQLTYKSISVPSNTIEDIQNILTTARSFNEEENITGCLIYTGKIFTQLLEGNEVVVKSLYESIKSDQRHKEVTLLNENSGQERIFPKWAMAYLKPLTGTEGPKAAQIQNDLEIFDSGRIGPDFSVDSFWINVSLLLTELGYYQN